MNRFAICFAASLVILASSARGEDDPVRVSLDKAKAEYEQSIGEYEKLVGEYFDKKEDDAREKGSKKQVDRIKAERDTFNESGELPMSAPATLKIRPKSVLDKLSVTYTKAIESYTRNKQDELATLTKRELAELKAKVGTPSIAGVWQEGDPANGIRVNITQNANKFTATCKYKHKEAGEIHWKMTGTITKKGEIKGELVHTKSPGFLSQTRTGTYSPSDGTISGLAEWKTGEHTFEWKLIED